MPSIFSRQFLSTNCNVFIENVFIKQNVSGEITFVFENYVRCIPHGISSEKRGQTSILFLLNFLSLLNVVVVVFFQLDSFIYRFLFRLKMLSDKEGILMTLFRHFFHNILRCC